MLGYSDEVEFDHFEQRQKGHDNFTPCFNPGSEKLAERHGAFFFQKIYDFRDALLNGHPVGIQVDPVIFGYVF